jgi:hypothetical protein
MGSRRWAGRRRRAVGAGVIIAAIVTGIALLRPGTYDSGHRWRAAVPSVRGTGEPSTARHAARRWEHELRRLDRLRGRAWRRGDPGGLRPVYVPGSPALVLDRRHLRSYLDRGFSVRGVRVRILTLGVIDDGPTRVRLDIVDRLSHVVATDSTGRRRGLPHDRPHRHMIELRRVRGHWRIAAIRERRV